LGGTPTTFAGYDLILRRASRPNNDRLNDPMLTNGAGQILQLALIETPTRILRIAGYMLNWDHTIRINAPGTIIGRRLLIHFAYERCKTAPEAPFR
jgi:hypothetical protein